MKDQATTFLKTFPLRLLSMDAPEIWRELAEGLLAQARAYEDYDPAGLSTDLLPLDRMLAEAAWGLWEDFPGDAPRTATALQEWWQHQEGQGGRAVLIMDALSLRELPLLLHIIREHGVEPIDIRATAAEAPTETNRFAQALGLPGGRSALNNPKLPETFVLASQDLFRGVFASPFLDCIPKVLPANDVVIWHEWLDSQYVHAFAHSAKDFESAVRTHLSGQTGRELWQFIEHLRYGRRLVITADHGYANTEYFSQVEVSSKAQDYLKNMLKNSRYKKIAGQTIEHYTPPVLLTCNGYHMALGLRSWIGYGADQEVMHGGLSLLEAFVPFIELPARY